MAPIFAILVVFTVTLLLVQTAQAAVVFPNTESPSNPYWKRVYNEVCRVIPDPVENITICEPEPAAISDYIVVEEVVPTIDSKSEKEDLTKWTFKMKLDSKFCNNLQLSKNSADYRDMATVYLKDSEKYIDLMFMDVLPVKQEKTTQFVDITDCQEDVEVELEKWGPGQKIDIGFGTQTWQTSEECTFNSSACPTGKCVYADEDVYASCDITVENGIELHFDNADFFMNQSGNYEFDFTVDSGGFFKTNDTTTFNSNGYEWNMYVYGETNFTNTNEVDGDLDFIHLYDGSLSYWNDYDTTYSTGLQVHTGAKLYLSNGCSLTNFQMHIDQNAEHTIDGLETAATFSKENMYSDNQGGLINVSSSYFSSYFTELDTDATYSKINLTNSEITTVDLADEGTAYITDTEITYRFDTDDAIIYIENMNMTGSYWFEYGADVEYIFKWPPSSVDEVTTFRMYGSNTMFMSGFVDMFQADDIDYVGSGRTINRTFPFNVTDDSGVPQNSVNISLFQNGTTLENYGVTNAAGSVNISILAEQSTGEIIGVWEYTIKADDVLIDYNVNWLNDTHESSGGLHIISSAGCTPDLQNDTWTYEGNYSVQSNLEPCNESDQQLNWTVFSDWNWTTLLDFNGCEANDTIYYDNNTYYSNVTIDCDYCTPDMQNTSWTYEGNYSVQSTLEDCNESDQQLNWTVFSDWNYSVEWDANECVPDNIANVTHYINNTYYSNVTLACDYCTPSLDNTSWTYEGNYSVQSTLEDCNESDQRLNWTVFSDWNWTVEWDTNVCGEIANYTHYVNNTFYSNVTIGCDYCTPSMENTTIINHANISCNESDILTLNWSWTEWDGNQCVPDNIANVTWYNYSYESCDYCVPSMVNTTPVNHANISCNVSDILTLNWSWIEWDENVCVPDNVANISWYNYTYEACDYCTPDLQNDTWTYVGNVSYSYVNGSCNESSKLTQTWSWIEFNYTYLLDFNACDGYQNDTYYDLNSTLTWDPGNYTYNIDCTYVPPVPLTYCSKGSVFLWWDFDVQEMRIGWGQSC